MRMKPLGLCRENLDLTYITAEREGPREIYPLEDQHMVPTVGPEGENAVSILFRGRDEHIADELRVLAIFLHCYTRLKPDWAHFSRVAR